MIQEQLHRVEIGAALQQTASSLAPEVVHVEIHFPQLLAAAGKESAGWSPVRTVTDDAKPKRRPGLLVVFQALADFVAEHVRVGLELLDIRIETPQLQHGPKFLRERNVPTAQALRRPVGQVQLVEVPSQLLELHVEQLADPTAGLQRGNDPQPPKPIVLGQRPKPFLLAWLEPALAFELAKLPNALRGIDRQVFAFQSPVEERLQPTQTSIGRHRSSA